MAENLIGANKGTKAFHTLGGGHEDKTVIRWGLADRVPWDQIQPRMVVDFVQMMVLVGDKRRLQRSRVSSTLSSWIEGFQVNHHHSRGHLQV